MERTADPRPGPAAAVVQFILCRRVVGECEEAAAGAQRGWPARGLVLLQLLYSLYCIGEECESEEAAAGARRGQLTRGLVLLQLLYSLYCVEE